MCISNKIPGDSDTAGPQATLPEVTVLEKHTDLCFSFLGDLKADMGTKFRERKSVDEPGEKCLG